MKKKILILGIAVMLFTMLVVLTGCGNNDNSLKQNSDNKSTEGVQKQDSDKNSSKDIQKQDNNITNIKEFLNKINSKDFDEAVSLIDKDKINEIMKINLPSDEFTKSLSHALNDGYSEMKYDTESIKKISKDDLLNEISKMDEKEIIKSRTDIIDLFDGYDLYMVEGKSSYENEKMNFHDVVFVTADDPKISGTVILNGLISYYYNAVYNKPTSVNSN